MANADQTLDQLSSNIKHAFDVFVQKTADVAAT